MAYLDKEVAELHARDLSQKQIAAELNCGLNTVRRRMKEMGLKPKSVGSRNYKINEDIFDIIDTEEKAYWLGFVLADGMIGKSAGTRRAFKISIQKRDEAHLKQAAKFFGHKGKLHVDNRDGHIRVSLMFNSVYMCTRLYEMGWGDFKSDGNPSIMRYIPDNLFNHFVRGYFDGDGCITCNTALKKFTWDVNIVGPHYQSLDFIRLGVENGCGSIGTIKRRKTVFSLYWTGRDNIEKVMDYIYRNHTICLNRKISKKNEMFSVGLPFRFNSIHCFLFDINTNELKDRSDKQKIESSFMSSVIGSGWSNPRYDYNHDYNKLKEHDYTKCIGNDRIKQVNGKTYGNDTILHFQPVMWHVSQNNKPPISTLSNNHNLVRKALNQFFNQKNSPLSSSRLIRELLFAGFTKASILSVPVIRAVLDYFKLKGVWFDPCAGWGNRMLAANLHRIEYHATDPGVCYGGLQKMKEVLCLDANLQNKAWQDAEWIKSDFIFTSPPFWNKEDYLDNVNYGIFHDWFETFMVPLTNMALKMSKRVIYHVDKAIKDELLKMFSNSVVIPLIGHRSKAPTEFFIEIYE